MMKERSYQINYQPRSTIKFPQVKQEKGGKSFIQFKLPGKRKRHGDAQERKRYRTREKERL